MNNKYFELARNEERSGNDAAALLLYLSSFCDSCNRGTRNTSYGTIAKIRLLQRKLMLTDLQLFGLIRSYGPLSDSECRKLLDYSIRGAGLSGYAYGVLTDSQSVCLNVCRNAT